MDRHIHAALDPVSLPAFASLTGNARFVLECYPPKLVFAVVSWGCAATGWLARVLNAQPDILCLHAGSFFWAELSGTPCLGSTAYLRTLACLGYAHKAAGDVHGIARQDVPQLRKDFGPMFQAVVVVRDPLPRLRSQWALFQRSGWSNHWNIHDLPRVLADKNVVLPSGSRHEMFFAHGARMLNAITEERAVGTVYRAEDLTSNPDVFSAFISEITQGAVQPGRAWLKNAVASEAINAHAKPETDASFEDWQVEAIAKIVEPVAWDHYESLGYRRPAFL